jgi:hypothetical protein
LDRNIAISQIRCVIPLAATMPDELNPDSL